MRWAVPATVDAAAWSAAFAENSSLHTTLDQVVVNGRPSFSPVVDAPDGGKALCLFVPLYEIGQPAGFIASIYHTDTLLDGILLDEMQFDETVAVSQFGADIYRSDAKPIVDAAPWRSDTTLRMPGLLWQLSLWPGEAMRREAITILPTFTLAIGMVLALLVALTVHLGITATLRARALVKINSDLEQRVAERTRDYKAANDDLQRQARELERSNEELEQFAYVASHDLQEPLRMVSSYMQLLQRRYADKLGQDANEFIRFAVDGAARMKVLINDLLAYSRVGSRGKPLQPTHCGHAFANALHNLELAIEESGAVITTDTLPPVIGDDSQLTQLFQNLLGNAIKFRRDDTPRIHVSAMPDTATESGQSVWRLSVTDNGIGIDAKYSERVFAIFQRLHQMDAYPGTGIGLSISRKIVERHGGRIWLEAAPEQGTIVNFTLLGIENYVPPKT